MYTKVLSYVIFIIPVLFTIIELYDDYLSIIC